jgi:hypothetical protein
MTTNTVNQASSSSSLITITINHQSSIINIIIIIIINHQPSIITITIIIIIINHQNCCKELTFC